MAATDPLYQSVLLVPALTHHKPWQAVAAQRITALHGMMAVQHHDAAVSC